MMKDDDLQCEITKPIIIIILIDVNSFFKSFVLFTDRNYILKINKILMHMCTSFTMWSRNMSVWVSNICGKSTPDDMLGTLDDELNGLIFTRQDHLVISSRQGSTRWAAIITKVG